MEAQFNFQLRHRNDKREWEEIGSITKPIATEPPAMRYTKTFQNISFRNPIDRGKEPLKTSGTYIYEQTQPLNSRNYAKLV